MNAQMILAYLRGARRSWTVWFNGVALAVLTAAPQIEAFLPVLKPYLDNSSFKRLTVAVLLLNLVLRIKTDKPLSEK